MPASLKTCLAACYSGAAFRFPLIAVKWHSYPSLIKNYTKKVTSTVMYDLACPADAIFSSLSSQRKLMREERLSVPF